MADISKGDFFRGGGKPDAASSDPMRDVTLTIDDNKERALSQKEGDIFLKHGEEEKSTGVIIRENQIALQVADGKYGILINKNGEINIQGKIINNTTPGQKKTKHSILGKTTENFLSFIPSTLYTEISGMLFAAPNMKIIQEIKDLMKKFLNL